MLLRTFRQPGSRSTVRRQTERPVGDPVRVLFLNTKRHPGLDADTWVHLQIMQEISRSAVEVHAACDAGPRSHPTSTYRALLEIPDVTIMDVDLGHEVDGDSRRAKLLAHLSLIPAAWHILRMAVYIRRRRIELIHTADRPRDSAAAVLLSRITPAKCIVHLHVSYDPGWMRPMLQQAIQRADALIAVSDFVAQSIRDADGDYPPIQVVLNGIDVDRWTPGLGREPTRNELGIAADTPVVVTVCRLFHSKGVSELVRAFDSVLEAVPDAVLLVVGAETQRGYLAELQTMVAECGLGEHVRFLGRRDDVAAIMAAADVFAMPSMGEPFGLVFAEAMAMELPVVGLDNGGTVEVVQHGVNGLLTPAGDIEALAGSLRTLLLDPILRASYGISGRKRVQRHFTTRRMADDTRAVFESLCATQADRAETESTS